MPHNGERTHCKRGHEFSPDNTYRNRKGHRVCRACVRLKDEEKGKRKPRETPAPPRTMAADTATPDANAWVRVLESPPGVRLETLDQFLAYYKVDLDVWEVERHVLNRYPVTVKDADGEPVVLHSFQLKAWLRLRKGKETLEELKGQILEDIAAASTYRPMPRPKVDPEKMLVIEPVDAHLGALSWGQETGGADYDLGIASRIYRDVVEGLLARAVVERPAKIVFRLGDDYLHIDSARNQTTAGTPQDVDSRYKKVFRMGLDVARHCIARCAELAPTHVVVVCGNHDSQSTFSLGEVMAAEFRDHPRVTVESGLKQRTYVGWGTVLLCFTHGDKEVPRDLPHIMLREANALGILAGTQVHEVHMGHLHRKRQMAQDEFAGVRVRWLPSIKATDNWHAEKGYVMPVRAAEAHLYSKTRGYLGTYSEPVMEAA